MSRLIFINRFYWPEEPATSQLLTDLTGYLAQHGHDVTVITSRPADPKIDRRETHRQVAIIRVGSTRWGKSSLIGRALDFLSFILGATYHLVRHTRRGDLVVFMTDPPFLAALVWPWCSLRGVRFVHWVQDIYPEIAIELTTQRWLRCLRPWRNLSWKRAAACVTLGEDMAGVLRQAGVTESKIAIIPNWAPAGTEPPAEGEVNRLRDEWGLTGKFVALYSGNLGRVHDLQSILSTAAALRDDKNIAIVFVGQGAQLNDLQAEVRSRALDNVSFFPPQPRHRLGATLALGDVHFVTMRPGCEGYVFPSKLYGIAAVGKPMIFIGPPGTELAHLVVNEGMGVSFPNGASQEIARHIGALRAAPDVLAAQAAQARDFARAHDSQQAAAAWDQLLRSI